MQIILISDRLARARSVYMSFGHLMGTAFLGLLLVLGVAAALYWLTLRYAAEVRLPVLQEPGRGAARPSGARAHVRAAEHQLHGDEARRDAGATHAPGRAR